MKEKREELYELLNQLSIGGEEAEEMVGDLEAGDELLDQYADPAVPPEVKEKILQRMQQAGPVRPEKNWRIPMLRIAAGIIIVIGIGAALWQKAPNQKAEEPTVAKGELEWLDDEEVIFEVVLAENDYEAEYDVDETSLSEWMWTQVNELDSDGSVREEYRDENPTSSMDRIIRFDCV
jgi:hypothetical protein